MRHAVTRGIVTVLTISLLPVGLVGCGQNDGTDTLVVKKAPTNKTYIGTPTKKKKKKSAETTTSEKTTEKIADTKTVTDTGTDAKPDVNPDDTVVTHIDADAEGIWVVTHSHESYQYDSDGDGSIDCEDVTDITYDIDEQGNITAVRMASSSKTDNGETGPFSNRKTIEYDENGFMTASTITEGELSVEHTCNNDLDATGRLMHATVRSKEGDETTYEFEYDEQGNVVGIDGNGIGARFDAVGNLLEVTGSTNHKYEYNSEGHLVKDTITMKGAKDGDVSMTDSIECKYDSNGNIVTKSIASEDGSLSKTTYKYTHVTNPSKGAKTYTRKETTLLVLL